MSSLQIAKRKSTALAVALFAKKAKKTSSESSSPAPLTVVAKDDKQGLSNEATVAETASTAEGSPSVAQREGGFSSSSASGDTPGLQTGAVGQCAAESDDDEDWDGEEGEEEECQEDGEEGGKDTDWIVSEPEEEREDIEGETSTAADSMKNLVKSVAKARSAACGAAKVAFSGAAGVHAILVLICRICFRKSDDQA